MRPRRASRRSSLREASRSRAAISPCSTDRPNRNPALARASTMTCAGIPAQVPLQHDASGRRDLPETLLLGDDLHLSVKGKSQQAAVWNAADPLRSDDHGHVVLARQDGGVAEPAADLADEAAGPAEIRQPVGIDHRRDDDVAVLEIAGDGSTLGIALGHDVGAAL